jgi:hypothetical protein
MLSESPDTLAKMMASTSRKGLIWGQKKVAKLVEMAQLCLSMPMEFSNLSCKIQYHLDGIEMFQNNQVGLKEQQRWVPSAPPAKAIRLIPFYGIII